MADFDFAGRKLVLEQERQDRQDEAKRIKEDREQAVFDLMTAVTDYLKTLNARPNVVSRSDTGFQILAGNASLAFSVNDNLTYSFKAGADTLNGRKNRSDSGLSAEGITDAILKFFHSDLEH